MEPFKQSVLLPGMTCIITKAGTYGDFQGRLVKLVKNFPTYRNVNGKVKVDDFWQTEPPLRGPAGPNGEIRQLKFSPTVLMSVDNTILRAQLTLELREDCKADPRIAGYILGRDAAYNWRQGKDPC